MNAKKSDTQNISYAKKKFLIKQFALEVFMDAVEAIERGKAELEQECKKENIQFKEIYEWILDEIQTEVLQDLDISAEDHEDEDEEDEEDEELEDDAG